MRLLTIAGMSLVLSGVWMRADAAPVELVCKSGSMEAHLQIDVDAGTVTWADQSFQATVTDTEVRWTGTLPPPSADGGGQTIFASFDRDSGTLVTNVGSNRMTWACTKAQKIL